MGDVGRARPEAGSVTKIQVETELPGTTLVSAK